MRNLIALLALISVIAYAMPGYCQTCYTSACYGNAECGECRCLFPNGPGTQGFCG
jgi:hypothetical protein